MENITASIDKERRHIPRLATFFVVVTLSGFATYIYRPHSVWQQWTFLLHTLAGFYLTFLLLPYLWVHFRRTIAFRRATQIIFGSLTVSAFAVLVITGLHIGIFGQYESLRWIYDWHIMSSYLALGALGVHLVLHPLLHAEGRGRTRAEWFTTLTPVAFKKIMRGTLVAVGTVALFTLGYLLISGSYETGPAVTPYELPYGDHPFRPSQAETVSGGFIDARQTGNSEKCGVCHEQVTRQWRSSIHGRSATDPAFQTNLTALAGKKGKAATRYCLGCHGPVALLSGQANKGGKLDGGAHIEEGVSCMACHGISKAVHLKGVGSYLFEPRQDYLFADKDNYFLTKLNNYLININPRQHRRDLARDILYDPRSCATCHVQYIDKEINNWGWIKLQDQYGAWLNGPWSGQSEQTFARREIQRCQDCHFPLVKSDDPSADTDGLVRSHRTPGANTAIPWLLGDAEQLAVVTRFLQDGRIRMAMVVADATGSGQNSNSAKQQKTVRPNDRSRAFKPGDRLNLKISVTNSRVGHNFPAGTTDLNEPWIEVRATDARGKLVYLSGGINKRNEVDPEAHFYLSLPINRQGKHVWRHDLFNVVGSSYEKLIPPGRSDVVQYGFELPAWVKGPVTIRARLRYRKLNIRYARWALKKDELQLPIVDMASVTLTVPISTKR